MYRLTQLRIVWTNACVYHITGQGYPFPNIALDTLPVRKLEQHACHAARLSTNWLSNDWTPIRKWSIDATANTSVGDVRIMPGSEGSIIFTLSKSVWSVLTVWQLEPVTSKTTGENCKFRKCCEWSPKGAIFNGFTLNSSPSSEAKLAISVVNNGCVFFSHNFPSLISLPQKSDCGASVPPWYGRVWRFILAGYHVHPFNA